MLLSFNDDSLFIEATHIKSLKKCFVPDGYLTIVTLADRTEHFVHQEAKLVESRVNSALIHEYETRNNR